MICLSHCTERPHIVDVVEVNASNMRVSWDHSLPKDSQLHKDLDYKVVKVSSSGEETELKGEKNSSKSVIVEANHGSTLKVCVQWKQRPRLGRIYSEQYKGTHMCCVYRYVLCMYTDDSDNPVHLYGCSHCPIQALLTYSLHYTLSSLVILQFNMSE